MNLAMASIVIGMFVVKSFIEEGLHEIRRRLITAQGVLAYWLPGLPKPSFQRSAPAVSQKINKVGIQV